MKRKAGAIVAMILAVTMVFGTVTIGAAELELTEITEDTGDMIILEDSSDMGISSDEFFIDEDNGDAAFGGEDDMISSDKAETSDKAKKIKSKSAKVFKKIAGNKNSHMYKKLTKEQKKIYDKIDKEVRRILYDGGKLSQVGGAVSSKAIKVPKHYKMEKLEFVFFVYWLNNPQAFFLKPECQYLYNDGKLYLMILKDMNSPSKIRTAGDKIAQNLSADAAKVKREKGNYKKVKKIQELLCARVAKSNDQQKCGLYYAYYGTNKEAHFYSYAASFEALARLSGFEAFSVPGSNGAAWTSVWNKIKVGKKWYNADPYWDDFKNKQSSPPCKYNFLLKSDKTINDPYGAHKLDPKYKKFNIAVKSDYKAPK